MYTGVELGAAIATAIEKKGVKKAEVAREFGIKQPSLSDWIKTGRIGKHHISKLIEYFSDVVPPSHFGIDNMVLSNPIPQHHSGNGDNIGVQHNNYRQSDLEGNNQVGLDKELMPDASMTPVLPENCELTIDPNQTHIIDGKIYQIQSSELKFIRRIYRQIDGSLKLVCENKDFESVVVPSDSVKIIGRVIAWKVVD